MRSTFTFSNFTGLVENNTMCMFYLIPEIIEGYSNATIQATNIEESGFTSYVYIYNSLTGLHEYSTTFYTNRTLNFTNVNNTMLLAIIAIPLTSNYTFQFKYKSF